MIEKLEGHELPPAVEPAVEGESVNRFEAAEPVIGADGREVEAPAPEAPADETPISIDPGELRGAIEAVLFSVSEPMPIRSIAEILGVSLHEVRAAVEDLRLEYVDLRRSFRIEDIAGGVQLLTLSRFDPWIRRLRQKEKESRLTAAALETLSVVAYKQPISKADLESVRGVGCGPTLKTLLERGLIQIAGRGEGLGRPLLYGTTKRFLESFGIASVRELPQPELTDRPPGAGAPPGLAPPASPAAEMAGVELPEGSVPDAPERGSEPVGEEPSLTDPTGPLS